MFLASQTELKFQAVFLLNTISLALCRLNEGHDYIMSLLAMILRLAVWFKFSLVRLLFWTFSLV